MGEDETRRSGRPTKLTPELAEQLLGYIRNGNYLTTAADRVGVHEATVYRWLERGEGVDQREDNADVTDEEAAAAAFYRGFKRARAEAEIMFVEVLVEDAKGGVVVKETVRTADGNVEETTRTPPNSKAALEWLARTKHDRWGSRKALEVSGPDGGPVTLNHQSGIVEHLAQRIAAVKAKRAAEQPPPAHGGEQCG